MTTVYPGYIRTAIHDAARERGLGLEGVVPAERLSDAAATLVRAALGPPARDLATTRSGTIALRGRAAAAAPRSSTALGDAAAAAARRARATSPARRWRPTSATPG